MTFQDTIQLLSNNLLTYFAEVYHSAEIVITDKDKFPAVTLQDEWINLSPVDTKETIYIRRNGDDEISEELKISSCVQSYKVRSPLRIVYFKDHAGKHNEILAHLMQSVLTGATKLNRIVRDKWRLLKDESNGKYTFSPKTAYFAIDIYVYWYLLSDTCDNDFCETLPNPMCHVES